MGFSEFSVYLQACTCFLTQFAPCAFWCFVPNGTVESGSLALSSCAPCLGGAKELDTGPSNDFQWEKRMRHRGCSWCSWFDGCNKSYPIVSYWILLKLWSQELRHGQIQCCRHRATKRRFSARRHGANGACVHEKLRAVPTVHTGRRLEIWTDQKAGHRLWKGPAMTSLHCLNQ